ncbi:MAG: TIR domain-containing protein [Verrucomicrobia bacterium]|nr:TIR domain-containing protein [Verrucomicrobiota bacterium]
MPVSSSSDAVFLSYAREDTDSARRIADALRGFGVEVWFDQSELRGGDAWDEKIRRQIHECALFLAVVSAHTHARREGYFRREWKLAVERTSDMAEGMPFLVPLAIDDTAESRALVPGEFLRVQWIRLPGGLPTAQFIEQIKRLLAPASEMETGRPLVSVASAKVARPGERGEGSAPPSKPRVPAWAWSALAVAALGVVAFFVTRKSAPPAVPPKPVAETKSAPAAPLLSDKSIAVLPFANLSPDKENEFFADGIHEDVLTNLQNIRELRVVSRTSAAGYRGTTKKIPEVARELGVAYILEGSVRRAGDSVRVTVQLIDARTDTHIWAPQPYDRKLTDIFAIQSELARAIANELKIALSPREKTLVERRPTENLEAYDLYLKARDTFYRLGDNPKSRKARESLLQAAVALDPKFAEAWAQLSNLQAYDRLIGVDYTPERLAKAQAAIDTAVRLAPDSPEVMLCLGGFQYNAFRDFARAAEQFERVTRLQPNNADPIYGLGALCRRTGRWIEAVAYMRKSVQLDPANLFNWNQLALLLEAGRRYDVAAAERLRITPRSPNDIGHRFTSARDAFRATGSTREVDRFFAGLTPAQADSPTARNLRKTWALVTGNLAEYLRLEPADSRSVTTAIVLATQGNHIAARARLPDPAPLRKRLETEPDNNTVWRNLSVIEALLGHADEALGCARKAVDLMPESRDTMHGPGHRATLAFVYAWTGDKDRAIAEYTRLLRVPFSYLNVHEMKTDPAFFPLRGDPRFEALLNDPKNNAPLF